MVVGFIQVRPWGCSVYAGTLGSLWFALRVVWFIRGLCVSTRHCTAGRSVHPWSLNSLTFSLGVVGFIRGRWVHSGSPWGSLGSL